MISHHTTSRPPTGPADHDFVLRETLPACDLGNTLFLKLCGFIQDQQARLLDVHEHYYKLKIGYSRWERFWHGIGGHEPVLVTLKVRHDATLESGRRSHAAQALVEIDIRPASLSWRPGAFQDCARHIVRRLRLHLMAN
jgi:hypothetical protein